MAALCECGCGQRTPFATETKTDRGWAKGEPLRFIQGHNAGMPHRLRRPDWSTSVVDFLVAERKRGETDYNAAWRRATKAHPPRGRDMGAAVPALFAPEDGQVGEDVSLVDFTEFVCGQAWDNYVGPEPGQGKALGRFTPDLLASMNDSSGPAGRTWRMEAA